MTPRNRILSVLAGEMPDCIPFAIWHNKLPDGEVERQLLEFDACVIHKSSVYDVSFNGIDVQQEIFEDGSARRIRTIYGTPAGDLTCIQRIMPGTVWTEKHLFTGEHDYEPLTVLLESYSHTSCYEQFEQDDHRWGDQCLARPATLHSPLHDVIYELMGIETFCYQWVENRDCIKQLCTILGRQRRRCLDLIARSPAQIAVVEGNVDLRVIGPKRFCEYYLPNIEEACRVLHAAGKYVGAHLDGDNRLLAPLLSGTSLDFIESFTPPPDCPLSLTDARQAWPDKTIMVNFPSSVHLGGVPAVEARARELLREVVSARRFIFGIMEDMPNRGRTTLAPLARLVYEEGRIGAADGKTLPRGV